MRATPPYGRLGQEVGKRTDERFIIETLTANRSEVRFPDTPCLANAATITPRQLVDHPCASATREAVGGIPGHPPVPSAQVYTRYRSLGDRNLGLVLVDQLAVGDGCTQFGGFVGLPRGFLQMGDGRTLEHRGSLSEKGLAKAEIVIW